MTSLSRQILCLVAFTLIPLAGSAWAASAHAPVAEDYSDEPDFFESGDQAVLPAPTKPVIKKTVKPAPLPAPAPIPAPAPARKSARKFVPAPGPEPDPVDTPDSGTEASANVPAGPGPNAPCLHGCGNPVHEGASNLFRALRDTFLPKKVDLLSLTGPNMSCAQIDLLKGAVRNVAREYNNYNGSHGNCGPAVGDSIRTAGRLFSGGDRVEGTMADFQNYNQYGVLFARILPRNGFIPTKARSVDEAPEGSVLVFAGPCSPGYRRPNCEPGRSAGEKWGHVTIKGSPRMDHGRQYYYTDGRTTWATNRERRYFIGAFLPPGSERGACQPVHQ